MNWKNKKLWIGVLVVVGLSWIILGPLDQIDRFDEAKKCNVEIPQNIKLKSVEAYKSKEINSDYIRLYVPENLCISSYPPGTKGYYLVHFDGPIYEDYKKQVKSLGGDFHGYIPDYSFIVKMNESAKERVEKTPEVRWVGIFQPAYKISPDILNKTGNLNLVVDIFDGENLDDIDRKIESFGSNTTVYESGLGNKIRVLTNASKIPDIANIVGVSFIEEYAEPVVY